MKNSFDRDSQQLDFAVKAKHALEFVCAGKALDSASQYYSPQFADHVNGMNFQGCDGVRRSVKLYTKVLSSLDLTVQEQLTDGDRVTSRFVVSGKAFGKEVRFDGITISRFEDGMIVEDWSVTDTLSMLRQNRRVEGSTFSVSPMESPQSLIASDQDQTRITEPAQHGVNIVRIAAKVVATNGRLHL